MADGTNTQGTDNQGLVPLSPAEAGERTALEGRMRDTHSWARDTAGQARYRELAARPVQRHREKEAGAPRPGDARRKAEIEGMMRDTRGEYYRSPAIQSEYREILEREEARGGPAGTLLALPIHPK